MPEIPKTDDIEPDLSPELPGENEAIFINKFYGKERLTWAEAMELIESLAGSLALDRRIRSKEGY